MRSPWIPSTDSAHSPGPSLLHVASDRALPLLDEREFVTRLTGLPASRRANPTVGQHTLGSRSDRAAPPDRTKRPRAPSPSATPPERDAPVHRPAPPLTFRTPPIPLSVTSSAVDLPAEESTVSRVAHARPGPHQPRECRSSGERLELPTCGLTVCSGTLCRPEKTPRNVLLPGIAYCHRYSVFCGSSH